ncbi:MAG: hypothetical protein NC225_00395 [Clostridium sp.]|nr:hypothetical protein [Clostridium sp.]MCM1459158.1 hypothetical protein [Bacteroides sp.]
MSEMLIAFIIWCAVGMLFTGIGIFAFVAQRPVGFWANAKMFEVTDVKKYNKACGIMWCIFGLVFIALGIPMLAGQNSPMIILSVISVLAEVIVTAVIYTLVIDKKYRKN